MLSIQGLSPRIDGSRDQEWPERNLYVVAVKLDRRVLSCDIDVAVKPFRGAVQRGLQIAQSY